jgi:hypothetical protein
VQVGPVPSHFLPVPLVTSIGGGTLHDERLTDRDGPFFRLFRLRAENDAKWLIYSAAYPEELPDGVPVRITALVRCPTGCSLSTAGRNPDLEKHVQSGEWAFVNLTFAYQKNGRPQHYAIGLNACKRGEYFEMRWFSLQPGFFPYEPFQYPLK